MKYVFGQITVAFIMLALVGVSFGQFNEPGLKVGFSLGTYLGETDIDVDLGDYKMGPMTRLYVRNNLIGHFFQVEAGVSSGLLMRDEYKTYLLPFDLRLVVNPLKLKTWNPYLYGGLGGLYYRYEITNYQADVKQKDDGLTTYIPLGVGLSIKLDDNSALDLHGGYNLARTDKLDGIVKEDNDAFYSAKIGFTVYLEGPNADSDKDGLTNRMEREIGTDLKNADTDGDGLSDAEEFQRYKTDPLQSDSDGDQLSDADELNKYSTNPLLKDTDEDGLDDFAEIDNYKTNPLKKDTDGDGLDDKREITELMTSPLKSDTDGDRLSDSEEISKTLTDPKKMDTDGDKIADNTDKCPLEPETVNGYEDEDGCPDKKPVIVFEKEAPIVLEGVNFKTGSAELTDEAKEVLGKVVQTLVDYPEMELAIEGHTDNTGRYQSNVSLSQKRADSVKAFLVSEGIDAARLTTKGLGPDQPVATNDTPEGRSQNRRISFTRTK